MADKRIIYEYKDKKNNRIIRSDNIVAEDENGIIERAESAAFRFIPSDQLAREVIAADYGYQEATMPQVPAQPNTSPYEKTIPEDNTKDLGSYYDYAFGLDKIELKKAKPKEVSGFLTQEIHIGSCDYIELSAKTNGADSSIEYSILDSVEETPILPVEKDTVQKEKLFFDLPLRFSPDPQKEAKIFKNGEPTTITLNEVGALDYLMNTYHVSYTPTKAAHIYHPKAENIRVKIIARRDSADAAAPVITSIVVLKYGGPQPWNI